MLEFFRKYQRFFFLFITVVVVASFAFFGTFSSFTNEEEREDRVIGMAVDGSPILLSEVQLLSRFIASDAEDFAAGPNVVPNFCNDGVIRHDLLRTGLAELLAAQYFEPLKEELSQKLERIKRFRPYMHPEASFLSAKAVWEKFIPPLGKELDSLQAMEVASPATFAHLANLYQQQSACPPEFLRRVLLIQHQQSPWLKFDPRLQYDDLSLFGFHTVSDWFGRDFVDLCAEFIINGARSAEKKGYRVSMEEAKGDLIRNFQHSVEKISELKNRSDLSFKTHLRMIGFDEKSAVKAWRSVLLFRRYFHGVGDAVFIDRLPYKDFASFALEKAVVQLYRLPSYLRLKTLQDLVEFQVYIQTVSKEKDLLSLPSDFLSLEEIEKKAPQFVHAEYRAKVAECHKGEIGLKGSVKEICDWQLEERNWEDLRKKFPSLPKASSRDERFQIIEKLDSSIRNQIDRVARLNLVDRNPSWIENQLYLSPSNEKKIFVSKNRTSLKNIEKAADFASLLNKASLGDEDAKGALHLYSDNGVTFYRIEEVEKISDPHILTFEEAKSQRILAKEAERFLESEYPKIRIKYPSKFQVKEGEWKSFSSVKEDVARLVFANLIKSMGGEALASRRFEAIAKAAMEAFKKDPNDSRYLKGSGDPLSDQFKFEKKQVEIQRTTNEEWMREQAFVLVEKEWSTLHVAPDGDISFFYFEEKKPHKEPILQQIAFGKEMISSDAQKYVAERLLEVAKKKNSMIIPVHPEKE